MDRVRVFFALPVPEQARQPCWRFARSVQRGCDGNAQRHLRIVPATNMHLTLAFLGEIAADEVRLLREISARICRQHQTLHLQFSQAAFFPSRLRPRALVLLASQNHRLELLQQELADSLVSKGYQIERRKFRPHITLARMRSRFDAPSTEHMAKVQRHLAISFDADAVALMRSKLSPDGARYTILFQHSLAG